MSRTKRTGGIQSPIKRVIKFSGSTGKFTYYDKEQKKNIEVGDEVSFIVLDVRASITGYNEDLGAGIGSNMVSNTTKEKLIVKTYSEGRGSVLAEGLYADIKEKVSNVGGKYTSNIFAIADFGEGYEFIIIELTGVALGSWIEFTAKYPNEKYYDYIITFKKGKLSKRSKGKNVPVTKKEENALDAKLRKNPRAPRPVWYYVIDTTVEDLTDELEELAVEKDREIQEYFTALAEKYSDNTMKKPAETQENYDAPEEPNEPEDDLPF